MKKAARMAEGILHDHHEFLPGGVTLVPGSGGIFEVTLVTDTRRNLFSKEQKGRFPEPGEVEEKLTKLFEADGR